MEGKINNDNKEELLALQGSKINGIDLAMQIYPLLGDYFCGTFVKNTKGILIKTDNGQVFQLTVIEVA